MVSVAEWSALVVVADSLFEFVRFFWVDCGELLEGEACLWADGVWVCVFLVLVCVVGEEDGVDCCECFEVGGA